ncbi:MAG TPA: hypothetical protein VFY60_12380 [Pyrinomonadaceae bacterium]|nr:hypothetical protein [Pyrinomonadaceae bacterium]
MQRRNSKKPKKAGQQRTAVSLALEEQQVLRSELEEAPTVLIPLEEPLPSGPRKGTLLGTPPPRLSNHKTRGKWFQARATWPVREGPVRTLVRERARTKKVLEAHPITADWENVGPSNIGGRTTSIVCHPTMSERIWIGAAGGGVWYSEDAGQNWHSLWRSQDILNIGSLAIDVNNPDTLFCGTGEANLSADSYAGVGLYKTTDAGKSWRLIADSKKTGIPSRIGAIAIDPFDSNHILIGGVGYAEVSSTGVEFGGMYVSFDGGVTWKRETFISEQNYWCHSIIFHPEKKGIIFSTFTEQGMRNGIWKTVDGGEVWTQVTGGGLPEPARVGRTSLAISQSNPDTLYAFAQDVLSGNRDRLLGVFRSANGGKTWKDIAGTHFKKERQISYNNAIAVHPTKPNQVICGGVDLHLTTDGGTTWKQVTRWDAERGTSNYAHADHHVLLIPTSAPDRVYSANDGGLDISEDGGRNWVNRSNGLSVTMFYDLDVAQTDGRTYGGGAQDNGTLGTITGRSDDFIELTGGDGGWMVIDPTDARHIYSSSQFMGIYRFRPSTGWEDVSPPATDEELARVWMVFITMDPKKPNTVYTGSTRVWRTKNDGAKWSPISPVLDGSPITAIEIAPADNKRIYIGTEDGGFFRSVDGGQNWSPNISSATLPGHTITRLESSPSNADTLFATVANFGHSHVFRSKNGGITWEDVDKGQLPNVPHHAVLIQPDAHETVYICNDVGVFISQDLGATWMNLTRNLPNVMIVDLAYHLNDRTLSAATYGRSIWRIRVS